MKDESVAETVADMRHAFVDDVVAKHVPEHVYAEQWDVAGLKEELKRVLDIELPVDEWAREEGIADEELLSRIEQRGYGQRDPLQEYKSEAFNLFETMIAHLREAVTAQLMRVEIVPPEEQQPVLPAMEAHKFDPNTGEDALAFAGASLVPQSAAADRDPKNPASWGKVGRNEDCPCGSGKKYKHCHGKYS